MNESLKKKLEKTWRKAVFVLFEWKEIPEPLRADFWGEVKPDVVVEDRTDAESR